MTQHGFEIERFEVIGSTNTYLLERAQAGAPGGLVAVADHQTAGRGRLDRKWESPAGAALLISVLLRERLEPEDLHLATAAVALSAVVAAERCCGLAPGLKWPNDLVIDDAKVAGVLAEVAPDPAGGPAAIVVGIGINLTWPGPPGVGGTCLLDATGVTVERDAMLDELLGALETREASLRTPQGRGSLVEELEARLVTIGREVRVVMGDHELVGTAVGLSRSGHLLIEVDGETREISAGDVIHLRAT